MSFETKIITNSGSMLLIIPELYHLFFGTRPKQHKRIYVCIFLEMCQKSKFCYIYKLCLTFSILTGSLACSSPNEMHSLLRPKLMAINFSTILKCQVSLVTSDCDMSTQHQYFICIHWVMLKTRTNKNINKHTPEKKNHPKTFHVN